MLKVSRESGKVMEMGPGTDRYDDLQDYTTEFVTFHADVDSTEHLKGLPGDACQCPHWGYVFKGRLTFEFADHTEVLEPGDAFYLPPGHAMRCEAGTEYLQFSPAEELAEVSAAIRKNIEAMEAAK